MATNPQRVSLDAFLVVLGRPPLASATTFEEPAYSPQLQATLLSTTKDPLMGESTYRLVNVSLAEPAAALFEVPADYTLTEGPVVKKQVYLTK